ncbi:serine protease [Kutzneria buriramensis]|uniref:V8-like Glu-specific endopeptidase n=1 Tax=Kutzneria buriramensis TaxID=1045776 RepID=A0A3E0GV72_9PSEU|nr:hypothetical protein [Kutzneria buriramensis]REH28461.1 hypothetical protein BCF44_12741 [Kutzneria buriramensis]
MLSTLGIGILLAGTVLAPPADTVATHDLTVSAADRQAVLAYWTPERIRALIVPSTVDNPPKSGPDGAPWTGGLPTVGRLFFTDHGEDASCTATVVDSANRSTIVTAGHCVDDTDLLGDNNAWNADVLFIPGYHDGQAPYGKFVGRLGVADKTWLLNDQQNGAKFDAFDQAFVVVSPNEHGRRVQDAVGGAQRIGFDRPGETVEFQFGYPRASSDPARENLPEYTGEELAYCHGVAKQYPGTPDYPDSPDQWGPACTMGGGSSGGPRIADFHHGVGTVVGDNTHAGFFTTGTNDVCTTQDHTGCTRYLVGPQFDSKITKPLYDRAAHS